MNIDVVIPTFNRLWAIEKVVPAYLANPEVHRVIVVDDGSTDGTYDWLNDLRVGQPRLLLIRHEEKRGACAARNTGAAIAEAPYVFFTDDDMLLTPENALRVLIDDLQCADSDIISPILEFREGIQPNSLLEKRKDPKNLLILYHKMTLERKSIDTLVRIIPDDSFQTGLVSGRMLMRRSVLEKVSYDENLGANSYRDETDFQLKAIGQGFRLLACPKVYMIDLFRLNDKGGCHSSNSIQYELLCCRNNWRILQRHKNVLQKKMGIKTPIQIMQMLFIAEHLLNRLPRRIFFEFRQKIGLIPHLKTSEGNCG